MKALDQFAAQNSVQLFPHAAILPSFFENNLIDASRVVKHFSNDPQANIRVFYYQYLKLCFELENVDFEGYIRKIEELINNDEFKFVFYEEDDAEVFNDLQFKQLIMEFFGVLGQGGVPLQQAINYYPVMDTVFIYFFRALLILTGHADALDSFIEREELFQFLCGYFNVDISIHDKCIKFVESDIFVYEEDPKDVFMAYMEDGEEGQAVYSQQQQYSQQNLSQQAQYSRQEQVDHHQQEAKQPTFSHQNHINQQFNPPLQPSYPNHHPTSVLISSQQEPHEAIPIHDISYNSSGSHRGNSEINKSYISSEFVDYTHTTSNLHSMLKKDLKESAEISRQPTFNNISQPARTNSKTNSENYKQTYEPVYNSPLAINSYLPFENSKQALSHLSSQSTSVYPSKINELASKTQIQQTAFAKKQEEPAYTRKLWEAAPTKDPGFDKFHLENSYQQTLNLSSSKYANLSENKISVSKPGSSGVYEQKIEVKKPSSAVQQVNPATIPYPSTYTSALNGSNKLIPPVASYTSLSPSLPQASIPQQGKNPYNLNVSLQFTNSFTMKSMAEPFSSNVRNIRSRARDYRNSLKSFIK